MTDATRPRRSRFDVGPPPDTQLTPDITDGLAPRTRRSRFDIAPTSPSVESLLPASMITTASQPIFGVGSSAAALSYLSAPVRPESPGIASKTFSLGGYELVLQRKLELAMTRNFEYLLRKDANPSLPVEQMPRGSLWAAGKDFGRAKKLSAPGETPAQCLTTLSLRYCRCGSLCSFEFTFKLCKWGHRD